MISSLMEVITTWKNHFIFFFNDTATTEIYTLSLHDALPIWSTRVATVRENGICENNQHHLSDELRDRKSTRLNSSHLGISYAVFCLKKKTWTRTLAGWPEALPAPLPRRPSPRRHLGRSAPHA